MGIIVDHQLRGSDYLGDNFPKPTPINLSRQCQHFRSVKSRFIVIPHHTSWYMQHTANTINNQLIPKSNHIVPFVDPNNNTNDYIMNSDYFAQSGQTSPIFKMERKWDQSVIELPKTDENDSRRPFTKNIVWNNKPYLIIISEKGNINDIEITIVDPQETNIIHQHGDHLYNRLGIDIHGISWSINQSRGELYMTIMCDTSVDNAPPKYGTLFLIYDLNAWKLKKRYLLNFKMNNGENFDDHFLQNISIINNNNFKAADMTLFHIINNWSRKHIDTSTVNVIPNDIYLVIGQFYSFCVKKNALQLIMFGFEMPEYGGEKWYLHHGIIDIHSAIENDKDDSVMDLELINSKQIDPTNQNHILSIRIDFELYVMFSNATWIIDMETGTMRQESKLLPYKEDDYMSEWKYQYFMAFDSIACIDSNDRFLSFLMEHRNKSIKYGFVTNY